MFGINGKLSPLTFWDVFKKSDFKASPFWVFKVSMLVLCSHLVLSSDFIFKSTGYLPSDHSVKEREIS